MQSVQTQLPAVRTQFGRPSPGKTLKKGSLLRWLSSLAAGALCLLALGSVSALANVSEPKAEVLAPVNINTATAEVLAERLVGIGLSRAQAIVAYRDANGNFQDAYELVAVRGVGEATVANNESVIRLRD